MIRWDYSEINNLYSLYINDEFMGVFDPYDYNKQKRILSALGH